MNKLSSTALAATLVAGCASQSGTTSGASAVATLESLYLAGAAAALAYESLPNANPAVVATIKADENIAFNALQALVSATNAGQSPDAAALAAAQAAIAALQAAIPTSATTATVSAAQGAAR